MENKFKNKGFTNIKGFTLVELVIVIAVIAILAGVLIPTFSNIIEKANASNDINLIRNINEVLVINSADNEVPQTKDEFKNVINEYGIKDFKNKAKNHIFYYIKEDNISIIWGIKEQRIIYPEYYNYSGSDIEDEINLSSKDVVNILKDAKEYNYNYCVGFTNNARLVAGGKIDDDAGTEGYVATGVMEIDTSLYNELTIYISGGDYDSTDYCAIHFIANDGLHDAYGIEDNMELRSYNGFYLYFTVYKISNNYFKIICTNYENLKEKSKNNIIYFATSLKGLGENLIISINEEIYD